jgi:hypothetical protein
VVSRRFSAAEVSVEVAFLLGGQFHVLVKTAKWASQSPEEIDSTGHVALKWGARLRSSSSSSTTDSVR